VNASDPTTPAPVLDASLRRYTNWMYGLHALAVAIGLTTAATVVGAFICGLPSIIAVIMNYARRAEARGTLFESHFRWQLRTFWFAVLWVAIASLVCAPLVLIVVGIFLLWIAFGAIGLWIIYRVLRGWLALRDGRAMPLAEVKT